MSVLFSIFFFKIDLVQQSKLRWSVSWNLRSYSLDFDLNVWFRAWKVTETFEKRAPAPHVLIGKDKLRFQVYIAGSADSLTKIS